MQKIPPLPNYDDCLVNLASSVLANFGATPSAATLPLADRYLSKNYKNVVVLLLDAMGTSIIEKHLSPGGLFRSHLAGTYSSVFPPTTVAATTAVTTGNYPCETGWLGWDCYFPQLQKNVTVYQNADQLQEKGSPFARTSEKTLDEDGIPELEETLSAADFNVAFRYIPYASLYDKIKEAGGQAHFVTPFVPPCPQTLDEIFARITEICAFPGRNFIYSYWPEPDHTMHLTGTTSADTHAVITELEKRVASLVDSLSDTLVLITADHGHMDSRNLCILDYPEIMRCLVRMPSIEPRALNLFIKEEYKAEFPVLFEQTFGDKFWVISKEEVIDRKFFGPGTEHPLFRDMLGDFLAIATAEVSLFNTHKEAALMPGGHAGLTGEELEIPLIVIEKN
ncbi:MAG: alkaline phosphatase family protein [Clostridiales bacterium]|nr:alkaline phosphatase family protein [Clostridiales bacterium]